MLRLIFLMAIRNVVQARRRLVLLGGALLTLTAVVVLLLSLAGGVRGEFLGSVRAVASGDVNVLGLYKPDPRTASVLLENPDEVRQAIEQRLPGAVVAPRLYASGAATSASHNVRNLVIHGIDVADEPLLKARLDAGGTEVSAGLMTPDTLVIFERQAERLGVNVGDFVTLQSNTPTRVLNTVDVEVVGIAEDIGLITNWTMFAPRATIARLLDVPSDSVSAFHINLASGEPRAVSGQLRGVMKELERDVRRPRARPYFGKLEEAETEDWSGYQVDVSTWSDELSYLTWTLEALETVSGLLVLTLLLILTMGITNSVRMSVRQRTAEIGTLRAMGMSRGVVVLLFVLEAALLALFASTVGAVVGALLAVAIDAAQIGLPGEGLPKVLLQRLITLRVNVVHLAMVVGWVTFFTALAAVWPSIRAARIRPSAALTE